MIRISAAPLERYSYRSWDSTIYLKIIIFIHRKNIKIIGVDTETQTRDFLMAQKVINGIDTNNINFLWATNAHVDARQIIENY